jgi:hypothetical protein
MSKEKWLIQHVESNTRKQPCVTYYVFFNYSEEDEEGATDKMHKLGFVMELLRMQNNSI